MEKMLAVIFKDEKSAYEAALALEQLDGEGSIIVNSLSVIEKNADGTLSTKQTVSDFPFETVTGTALGSLVGLLGGPFGLAVGAATGAVVGLMGDVFCAGIDIDFLSDVSEALTPGKLAVVADIDEDWVTPVDTRMEALGGVVYRAAKIVVEDDHWTRAGQAARAELERLKIELAKARADRKARLQAQIERLSARIQRQLARARAHSEATTAEFEAKVKALQKKADREQGDARAALEARITQLRKDYERRQSA